MKIFAYNLCLEFRVHDKSLPFSFELLSFDELMMHLFKGTDFPDQVFYVRASLEDTFVNNLMELQGNEIWRNLRMTVCAIFESKEDMDRFWSKFVMSFQKKEAAGGLVENEKGEYLFIYSRDKWTLPKGGVDWGETAKEAAVREVKEETGVTDLELKEELPPSYHTFYRRRRWVLKVTHWYKMKADSSQTLTPQKQEGIESVEWVSRKRWFDEKLPTYPLIRNLMEEEFTKNLV